MNRAQQDAIDHVKAGRNVFLTGPAGTGKSFALREIIKWATESSIPFGVTASTGSAALLLGGRTLHSYLGIGLGKGEVQDLVRRMLAKKDMNMVRNLQTVRLLIIDEISMINNDLFDKVSKYLCVLRKDSRPFGGVQIVLCGDFFQLPPVEPDYAFLCDEWDRCDLAVCMLQHSFRQESDTVFGSMLMELRWARVSNDHRRLLSALLEREPPEEGIVPTRLFALNRDVDRINQMEYEELKKDGRPTATYETTYSCNDAREWASTCNVPHELELCVGAQVVLTRNLNQQERLVNGSRGVVVSLANPDGPVVRFRNGYATVVAHVTAELEEKTKLLRSVKPMVTYMPLRLAYALTIHKSQGMTLDAVTIDLGNSVFSPGQAYTALSRAKNLESVWLLKFSASAFKIDNEVAQFYSKHGAQTM